MMTRDELIQKAVASRKAQIAKAAVADGVKDLPLDEQPDRGPAEAQSTRLGDMRTLNVIARPNETRTYADTGAAQAMAGPDSFLHGQVPNYIGGVTVEDNGGGPVMGYEMTEPDADARGALNLAEPGEHGIAPAAGFKPSEPGKVGGVSKSIWRDVFNNEPMDGADAAGGFLGSVGGK
jgi:hypothetical protein